jgi:hypothetical protein
VPAIAIFLLLLLLDGLYVGIRLEQSLHSAGTSLQLADAALTQGHVTDAAENLAVANDSSNVARGLTLHPSFVLASWIPGIDHDVRSVAALSDAARLSTDAGGELLRAVRALGVLGGNISPSIYRNGQVQFDPIDRAAPLLSSATHLLAVAQSELTAERPQLAPMQRVVDGTRLELSRVLAPANEARAMISRLPSILGRGTRRRYLLAFQALGEARGTGGVIGLYGVLAAHDGNMSLAKVGYLGNLIHGALPAPVKAPKWFQQNYGAQFATRQWQQVDLSPNFPAVSTVLLNMYQAATGKRLDGVIAMDPIALQDLLPFTGPIKGPGISTPLTSDNAGKILMRDSYVAFPDRAAQDRFLSTVVQRFWQKVSGGRFDTAGVGAGLRRAAITQHLKMFSRIPEDQRALAAVGGTGALTAYGPSVQMIFNNNYSANKVDYYLRRRIHTTVRLNSSGGASVQNTVVLHNYAPAGPPSTLLGPSIPGDPPGLNRMILNFLLPQGATRTTLSTDGRKSFPLSYRDSGRPLDWTILALRPGERRTENLSYRLPGAVQMSGGREFRFVLFPQATVIPDRVWVKIVPPTGWKLTRVRGSGVITNGQLTLNTYFSTPETIDVRLSRR